MKNCSRILPKWRIFSKCTSNLNSTAQKTYILIFSAIISQKQKFRYFWIVLEFPKNDEIFQNNYKKWTQHPKKPLYANIWLVYKQTKNKYFFQNFIVKNVLEIEKKCETDRQSRSTYTIDPTGHFGPTFGNLIFWLFFRFFFCVFQLIFLYFKIFLIEVFLLDLKIWPAIYGTRYVEKNVQCPLSNEGSGI